MAPQDDDPAAPGNGGDAGAAEPPSEAAAEGTSEPEVTIGERSQFRRRHTWPQRLLLALNIVVIIGCFAGAAGLVIARELRDDIPTVALPDLGVENSTVAPNVPQTTSEPLAPGETLAPGDSVPQPTAPVETFPAADPQAKNFLITGADNNACIDPDSPYAAAFGDRSGMGERSDTVMIMRVDPASKRAAVLSFPRDLWVQIAGTNRKSRINSAYVRDDPTKLIFTLWINFELHIDHFIQIDFCAFKTIVDAIDGGVGVPFEYPARDTHTGLYVPEPGCFYFDGDHALAYVRSRYYQYFDENGKWKSDPVSDLGRVSRQQDFIRRVLDAALSQGLFNPSIARGLLDAATNNVTKDDELTLSKMLEFVGVLRDIDPGGIATYQIEAVGKNIQGNSVLEPRLNGENMQAILRIFRGQAPLAEAPEQVFETTTTSSLPAGTDPDSTDETASTVATTTTVAPVDTTPAPEENVKGIVPPRDVSCP